MGPWLRLSSAIDRLTDRIGRLAGWLTLLMVLIGAYNAVVRYLGRYYGWNLSSNAYIELQWYLFSLVFLLGSAYTLKEGRHVRVDVAYGRLSQRVRSWIDLVGTVVMLVPFCLFTLWVSWPSVAASWSVREVSPDPGGLPRYPIKTVILVGFALILVQAVSELIKHLAGLRAPAPAGDEAAGEFQGRGV